MSGVWELGCGYCIWYGDRQGVSLCYNIKAKMSWVGIIYPGGYQYGLVVVDVNCSRKIILTGRMYITRPGPSDRFLGKNLVVTGKMINFAAVISNSKKL